MSESFFSSSMRSFAKHYFRRLLVLPLRLHGMWEKKRKKHNSASLASSRLRQINGSLFLARARFLAIALEIKYNLVKSLNLGTVILRVCGSISEISSRKGR